MNEGIGAMRMMNELEGEEIKKICVATIYNIFGFLGLDDKVTMTRSDLEMMLKQNIKHIK